MNIYPSTQDSERILGYLINRLNKAGCLNEEFQSLSDKEFHDFFTRKEHNGKSLLDYVHEDLTDWVNEIQEYFINE